MQVRPAEAGHGRRRHRHRIGGDQPAVGVVAVEPRRRDAGAPVASLDVGGAAVRPAVRLGDVGDDARALADGAGRRIEAPAVDPGAARIAVEHDAAVGAPGEAVAGDQPVDLGLDAAAALDPVERGERLAFARRLAAVVHRTDPEGAVGADLAVVEARVGIAVLDRAEPLEGAAGAVEQADLVAQRHHQPAALGQPERADLAVEVPARLRAAREIDAVDRPSRDVLEEQRVFAVVVDRALAELAADGFVERLEIEHRWVSCSATGDRLSNHRRP